MLEVGLNGDELVMLEETLNEEIEQSSNPSSWGWTRALSSQTSNINVHRKPTAAIPRSLVYGTTANRCRSAPRSRASNKPDGCAQKSPNKKNCRLEHVPKPRKAQSARPRASTDAAATHSSLGRAFPSCARGPFAPLGAPYMSREMRSRAQISAAPKGAATHDPGAFRRKGCKDVGVDRSLGSLMLGAASMDMEPLLLKLREMEDALTAAVMEFGSPSTEVRQICESTVKELNGAATVLMRRKKMKEAHEMLKKAEMLTTSKFLMHADDVVRIYLRSTTLNNLACYWLRRGSPRGALKLLNQALALERSEADKALKPSDCGITYMNMCVTLSKLGRHREALACINSAITGLLMRKEDLQGEEFYRRVMASAYHNLATEHEHLKQLDEAKQAFRCAKLWAKMQHSTPHVLRRCCSAPRPIRRD